MAPIISLLSGVISFVCSRCDSGNGSDIHHIGLSPSGDVSPAGSDYGGGRSETDTDSEALSRKLSKDSALGSADYERSDSGSVDLMTPPIECESEQVTPIVKVWPCDYSERTLTRGVAASKDRMLERQDKHETDDVEEVAEVITPERRDSHLAELTCQTRFALVDRVDNYPLKLSNSYSSFQSAQHEPRHPVRRQNSDSNNSSRSASLSPYYRERVCDSPETLSRRSSFASIDSIASVDEYFYNSLGITNSKYPV